MEPKSLSAAGENEYGITRSKRKKRFGWQVFIHRQGQPITRYFDDGACGGKQEALEIAKAYRDEVVRLLPPVSNLQQAQKLRKNNTSGVPGVVRVTNKLTGTSYWRASLGQNVRTRRFGKIRSKNFSIAQYGEEEAKALAIAQRQRFLEEMTPALIALNVREDVAAMSKVHFAEQISVIPQPKAGKWLDREELKAQLADLNARFDALIPHHMHVRVKLARRGKERKLEASILSTLPPAFSEQAFRMQPLQATEVLPEVREFLTTEIASRFGKASAEAFLRDYGEILHPERFDPVMGFKMELFEKRDGERLAWEPVPEAQP